MKAMPIHFEHVEKIQKNLDKKENITYNVIISLFLLLFVSICKVQIHIQMNGPLKLFSTQHEQPYSMVLK